MRFLGLIVALLIAVVLAFGTLLWSRTNTRDSSSVYEQHVARIEVRAHAGDVRVIRTKAQTLSGHVEVHRRERWTTPRPTSRESRDSHGTLHLRSDCHGWLRLTCSTRWTIYVPADVEVDVHTGSGDVRVEGTVGAITARTDSGDIHLRDVVGNVDARTDSGDVDVAGEVLRLVERSSAGDLRARLTRAAGRLRGPSHLDLHTDSGDVDASIDGPFDELRATTDSGDVVVRVQPGGYDVHAHTDSGDVQVAHGVFDDARARTRIDAKTQSGDVHVNSRAQS